MKKKVLVMTSLYVPSVKGGGPIQSIKNLVDSLFDKIDFYIITEDRDLGDDGPFENIKADAWISVGNAKVFYTNIAKLSWRKLSNIINSVNYDIIYLNSFFNYKFSIIPILLRRLNKIQMKKFILAPRGQFSQGALGLNSEKKRLFIEIVKISRLYNGIMWHATTNIERVDIHKVFGTDITIKTARNLTPNYRNTCYNKKIIKKPGELKLVYISRIHPMKNILQVLEILRRFDNKIEFNIYGPVEDNAYWDRCKKVIDNMEGNVVVNYNGLVSNDKVNEIYKQNHVSILLTLGENFGHSISESLIGGCPVIISDKTPWRNMEVYDSGWDLPLENSDLIVEKIKYFLNLDNDQYSVMSKSAFEYGKSKSNSSVDIDSYYRLFDI